MTSTSARPKVTGVCRPTTIVESAALSARLGCNVTIASETFQWTGSFKFRAAYNLAASRAEDFFITASSGNFGQALAYACKLLGKRCIVVMPATSAKVKITATQGYGATVDLVDVSKKSRAQRVAEIAAEYPQAYVASAYDDQLVIEGNSTLGYEIAALEKKYDLVVAPIGGGGLISGIITGLRNAGRNETVVIGAEPLAGNDAARSLAAGKIIENEGEPKTIADGARTVSLGKHNWQVIKDGVSKIIEVPDEKIAEALRVLFDSANLKVEPTGALTCAALLTRPEYFTAKNCLIVASGGNVDPEVYLSIMKV